MAAPLAAPWIVAYRLVAQGHAAVAAEIRVLPVAHKAHRAGVRLLKGSPEWDPTVKVPRSGVTSRLLRDVRVATHGRERRQLLESFVRALAQAVARGPAPPGRPLGSRRPRGRKGLPDLEYAKAAALYVKTLKEGTTRPVALVAKARGISVAQARDLIHRSRRHDMLTPAGSYGVPGGWLTDKARHILGQRRLPKGGGPKGRKRSHKR